MNPAAKHTDNQRKDVRRWRSNRQNEIDSAMLYDALAEAERDAATANVYRKLAATEREHAAFWETRLRAEGFGLTAAGLTFAVGRLIGVSLAA